MMNSALVIVFGCSLLLAIFQTGYGIECYKCASNDGNCVGGEKCTRPNGVCFKQESVVDGRARVTKGCYSAGVVGCAAVQIFGVGGTECICNTDLCNSAPSFLISPLTTLLTATFAAAAYRFLL